MTGIYLDNAATTRPAPAVVEAMLPLLNEAFGNPSSGHAWGRRVRDMVETARRSVARLIGADPAGVFFTSGGTEANNLAIFGLAGARPAGQLVVSAAEHPAVGSPADDLEASGWRVTRLPVDTQGRVDPTDLARALTPETVLVSVMLVNNVVGTVQPVAELAALARARGVPLHTDAVQAAGHLPLAVDELGVELLTLSSHKIHGPKGVGALYVRPGSPLHPRQRGGHQEGGRRPGTENAPGIVGFGVACELAAGRSAHPADRLAARRDRLERAILARVPGASVTGHGAPRAPHIANIAFPGRQGESLVIALDLLGVAVSAGSACSAGASEPSPVLRAMGLPRELAHGAVRFSLSVDTTDQEVDEAAARVAAAVASLQFQSS